MGEFEGRSSLKTWLSSIVVHAVREHRRSMRRKSPRWFQSEASVDPDALLSRADSTQRAVEQNEAGRQVQALLDALDHEKRTVFVLAELEQMTANEIADATGMTVQAVYSRLRAARTDFERAAARLRRAEDAQKGRKG